MMDPDEIWATLNEREKRSLMAVALEFGGVQEKQKPAAKKAQAVQKPIQKKALVKKAPKGSAKPAPKKSTAKTASSTASSTASPKKSAPAQKQASSSPKAKGAKADSASIADLGREKLIGTWLKKAFNGAKKKFKGQITQFIPKEESKEKDDLYHVVYEDGDEEDMYPKEVAELERFATEP